MKRIFISALFVSIIVLFGFRAIRTFPEAELTTKPIITGADQTEKYLPYLKGKRIGILANQTTIIGKKHLVDSLYTSGINIVKVFGPEHGFRGTAGAGEKVGNYVDEKTGIPVISLYGSKRRPEAKDLKDVDIMIFDIQDVGVRFYTYISSMQEYMEAALFHQQNAVFESK